MPRIETADRSGSDMSNYGARDRRARSMLSRVAPRAGFVSQLIAERYHLSPQRQQRQAPVSDVLLTYDAGGHMSDRRLPPGYRMNIEI